MANMEEYDEIDAEEELRPRAAYPSLRRIAELYGWYILLVTAVLIFVYKRYIAPLLLARVAEKELEERKKHDTDARMAYEERVRAARDRVQAQYEADTLREKERQKVKEQEALQSAIRKHGLEGVVSMPSTSRSSNNDVDARTFVMNKINSVPVVVFSKSWCAFSRKAKQALSTFRIPNEFYEICELDEMDNGDSVQDALLSVTGSRAVPHVFIGGQRIGGADETIAAMKDGRLKNMLQDAGVIG